MLKHLSLSLYSNDAVSFYNALEIFRVTDLSASNGCPTSFILMNDQWNLLYSLSKQRACQRETLEVPPKFKVLKNILLKDIPESIPSECSSKVDCLKISLITRPI